MESIILCKESQIYSKKVGSENKMCVLACARL